MEGNEPITCYYHDACTLYELFLRGLRESSESYASPTWRRRECEEVILRLIWDLFSLTDNGPCLGSRKPNQPYKWQSYREVSPYLFPDWHSLHEQKRKKLDHRNMNNRKWNAFETMSYIWIYVSWSFWRADSLPFLWKQTTGKVKLLLFAGKDAVTPWPERISPQSLTLFILQQLSKQIQREKSIPVCINHPCVWCKFVFACWPQSFPTVRHLSKPNRQLLSMMHKQDLLPLLACPCSRAAFTDQAAPWACFVSSGDLCCYLSWPER